MDKKQKLVTKVFTKAQLEKMSPEDLAELIGKAGPNAVIRGRAIVRKADGTIRCDEGVDPKQFEGV